MTFTVRKSRLKSVFCLKRIENVGDWNVCSIRQVSSGELAVGGAINRYLTIGHNLLLKQSLAVDFSCLHVRPSTNA